MAATSMQVMHRTMHSRLLDRWPGRRDQVSQLLAYLGDENDLPPPLFLYGPPSTGKTSIIREVLTELGRPVAYVSCAEFSREKPLLQSIADQLKGHKRKRSEGYCTASKAENLADFVVAMQGVCQCFLMTPCAILPQQRIFYPHKAMSNSNAGLQVEADRAESMFQRSRLKECTEFRALLFDN
eukprot:jgi/Botrbrau1/10203/Bobra.116_1s0019.1